MDTRGQTTDGDLAALRHRMVKEQLQARGIHDKRLLETMENVPRHKFVPAGQVSYAYDDGPLPIGSGQTISQPYIVACMTELLKLQPESRVLEIGTGSGYQTAILAGLAGQVWSIERLPDLAGRAERILQELGYTNIQFITGDGSRGHEDEAPYNAVLVTAAAPRVPDALRAQLAIGGRMVIPRTHGPSEDLLLIERLERGYRETSVMRCVFVPLIGIEGYSD